MFFISRGGEFYGEFRPEFLRKMQFDGFDVGGALALTLYRQIDNVPGK
jgi:hypothetical protein